MYYFSNHKIQRDNVPDQRPVGTKAAVHVAAEHGHLDGDKERHEEGRRENAQDAEDLEMPHVDVELCGESGGDKVGGDGREHGEDKLEDDGGRCDLGTCIVVVIKYYFK